MNERMLCRIWQAQRFSRPLVGAKGEAVEIVYRGYCQAGAGPDFQEALLAFSGELRSGDVEVHVRASDWWSHGHHRNPRYDGVILHVVLLNDREHLATTAAGAEMSGRLPPRS